jgi:hypothetical protein
LYSLFFKERFNHFPAEAKIISLVDVKANYNLNFKEGTTEDVCNHFIELTGQIVNDLYNSELEMAHDESAKYCSYC